MMSINQTMGDDTRLAHQAPPPEHSDVTDADIRFVFTDGRPEFLYGDHEGTVEETFHFSAGDDAEHAAVVRVEADEQGIVGGLSADDRVKEVECDTEFTLHNDAPISTHDDDLCTIEDTREIHDIENPSGSFGSIRLVATDTGLDDTHAVFQGVETTREDFTGDGPGDAHGHGTATLGEAVRTAQAVERAESWKILGDQGRGGMRPILRMYEHAITVAENDRTQDLVINMSWGATRRVPAVDRIHNKLVAAGAYDVVASGNSGGTPGSPATAEKAHAVGAVDQHGSMAGFSDAAPEKGVPLVVATGVNCRLPQAEGTAMGRDLAGPWVAASGTSFAAPHAAGIVCLLRADNHSQPYAALGNTARNVTGTRRDGDGIADHTAAEDWTGDGGADSLPTAELQALGVAGMSFLRLDDPWLDGRYQVRQVDDPDGPAEKVWKIVPWADRNK